MRQLAVGDVTLAVVDDGAGPPILFIHGFPLSHRMWRRQLDYFASRHRVIAPDLRGFGASAAAGGSFGLDRYADDLARLLDRLEVREPVVVCALSMGGYIAWEFFLRHRTKVRALILCDTRAVADTPDSAANRAKQADAVLRDGIGLIEELMIPRLFCPATMQQQPGVVEMCRQMMRQASPLGVAAALGAMARRPDQTGMLGRIDVPTLVLVGEHDLISPPAEMGEIAGRIPHSQFAIIPNVGHMAPLEDPRRCNQQIEEFLANLPVNSP